MSLIDKLKERKNALLTLAGGVALDRISTYYVLLEKGKEFQEGNPIINKLIGIAGLEGGLLISAVYPMLFVPILAIGLEKITNKNISKGIIYGAGLIGIGCSLYNLNNLLS